MYDGWIKTYRCVKECANPFDMCSAWLYLISHSVNSQYSTTIKELANKWGWSLSKTTIFLKTLESDEMLTLKKSSKEILITILRKVKG